MSWLQEKELFKKIAEGDESAFKIIYLRYTAKLYPHVCKLLSDYVWAEEIIQDVFTQLWQNRAMLAAIDNPAAYLYRMAANRTLDYLKHKSVEIKSQYKVKQLVKAINKRNPEQEFDVKQLELLFSQAITRLSPQRKKIFIMRHELGLHYDEIASNLQLSKNTVRNHLSESLQMVRKWMVQQGVTFILISSFFLNVP
ncbi:hypothetical protein A8C56_15830 [Niabella ginsenosidivorans]|uniref:RNA polymerase sigma-70 factor n=1 Tax=Niabella ginsenosidivorans TaxID=1176587 RepID=A0A1A9I3N6_9BACT|nr:RNA polymerase sigma-70 factor [Niabella ginsenosidivorans]ANH82236.1 hypothetical protein A8C56_15830 [Niabella ginsenosidivorans]